MFVACYHMQLERRFELTSAAYVTFIIVRARTKQLSSKSNFKLICLFFVLRMFLTLFGVKGGYLFDECDHSLKRRKGLWRRWHNKTRGKEQLLNLLKNSARFEVRTGDFRCNDSQLCRYHCAICF